MHAYLREINISMVKLILTNASEMLKIAFSDLRCHLPLEFNFYNFNRQTFERKYRSARIEVYTCT